MSRDDHSGAWRDKGERKLVTTLFADLSGFTALSDEMDAEEVRELVNSCFDVLVPVIVGCGGTVDKFIGDAVMALFGAPAAHEDDVVRCLTAALVMMDRFATFAAGSGRDLGMHVGVESGMVVSGGVGSRGREEYSVIGDSVNLSARLADASTAGQILVGPAARRLAGEAFRFRKLPPLALKGKSELVTAFSLEGIRCDEAPGRTVASRLVGRDAEMRLIGDMLESLSEGAGGVIVLSGEPGIGKSRLVVEARAASPQDLRWAEGKGRAFGRSTTFAVAAEMLDDLVGVSSDASPAAVEEALRDSIRSVLSAEEAATFPYLAWLRGLSLSAEDDEHVRHLLPEALRDRLRDAFVRFIEGLSRRQRLVLVWEDLHWADASSLALIEAVLPLATELPLVSLLVFRPHEGDVDGWRDRIVSCAASGPLELELAPLDERSSAELVDGLLPVESLPEEVRSVILEKGEGNPFFLEELLRSLLDTGLIVVHDGVATAAESAGEIALPGTLHGVAAARIDALKAPEKENLQSASVIGREFQRSVLAGMRRRAEEEGIAAAGRPLGSSLQELCRRELVRERGSADYIFKHAVLRDVAYGSLLRERRRALHRMAAEAIEELFPDRRDELAAALGRHWQAAGVPERALGYLLTAAGRARRSCSSSEALDLYAGALEAAGEDRARRAAVQEDIGDVLALAARFDEARVHLRAALTDIDAAIDRARVTRKIAETLVFDRPAEAARAFEEAESALGPLPEGEAPGWWHEAVETHSARQRFAYWVNDASVLSDWTTWAMATLQRPEAQAERGTLLRMLATHELAVTRYRPSVRALEWTAGCVEESERGEDLAETAAAYFLHAFVLMWCDKVDEAMSWCRRTIDACRRIGDATDELRAFTYLAVLYRRRGEVDEVLRSIREWEGLSAAARLDVYGCLTHGNRAWVAWRLHDPDTVREEGEAALEILGQLPHMPLSWIPLWPLLAVRLQDGDIPACVDAARRLVHPSQMLLPDDLEGLLGRGILEWEAGREEEAREALDLAVRRAQDSGWGWL